ncbi:MAG: hypothetical protein KBD06_04570 [Candidatus Pacebacteria bacterium]|nr:hypothetical protein [Candidatus Paceibacterota bacterium]
MIVYKASADRETSRSESFWNMFRSEHEIYVVLPGATSSIRIPTTAENDNYWERGPTAFNSPQRFDEVRAYMRHYFVDADSAPQRWEHNARIHAAIVAAIDACS